MHRTPSWFCGAAAVWVAVAMGSVSAQEIVYDNVANPLTTGSGDYITHYSQAEFGDEISLAGSGRVVTSFFFYYYGQFVAQQDEQVRIRFYANDGPSANPKVKPPGTLLYESQYLPLEEGYRTFTLSGLGVEVPDSFTWTVEYSGLSGASGDRAGLLLYNPPTVGKSFNDFWTVVNGTWQISQFPGGTPVANFAARVVVVPEPGVTVLGGLGLLMILGARRARRG